MKNKKILALVAGVALLSNFALAGMAFAVDGVSNSEQPINTVGLTVASAPGLETFTAVSASTGALTSTLDFANAVNIRGAVTLATGLELSVTGTPWFSVNNYGTSFSNTSLSVQTASAGGVTAIGTATGITCSNLDDVVSFTALPAGGDQTAAATGASGAVKIIDDTTTGLVNFDCLLNPQLSLAIPAGQSALTYRSTLTFTLSDL